MKTTLITPLDFNATPDEAIAYLIDASEISMDKCKGHNHPNAHCEMVHFHPMATPSEYIPRGKPDDLDPSLNRTSWFNELNQKIYELSQATTSSSAMSLTYATRHPRQKDRHCWANWTEYVQDDYLSMKACRTLSPEAKDMMENTVCNHIKVFNSFGRRPAAD